MILQNAICRVCLIQRTKQEWWSNCLFIYSAIPCVYQRKIPASMRARRSEHINTSKKACNLKFTTLHNSGGKYKFDDNYSRWALRMFHYSSRDTNRIQTAYSSLSDSIDSTILLTKYPTALGNNSVSSTKMEQHTASRV